jgi:hypothetical protein
MPAAGNTKNEVVFLQINLNVVVYYLQENSRNIHDKILSSLRLDKVFEQDPSLIYVGPLFAWQLNEKPTINKL